MPTPSSILSLGGRLPAGGGCGAPERPVLPADYGMMCNQSESKNCTLPISSDTRPMTV